MENKQYYTVFSLKMKNYLESRGWKYACMEPNKKNPGFYVFRYELNPDIIKDADAFLLANRLSKVEHRYGK